MDQMSFVSDSSTNQPLRVVHVIARMNVGGPAVLITEILRHLDKEKFDVRLISGNCNSNEADYVELQAPDVRTIRMDRLGRSVSAHNDLLALYEVADQLRDIQPHIVHTHTAKAGVLGRIAKRLASIDARVVHTFHGHLLHGYFGPAKTKGVTAVETALALGSDCLVAVSPEVRDELLAVGVGRRDQYRVIPPGVQLGPLPSREAARLALQIPLESRVVLYLGRVTQIKRPDRFVEAARIVNAAVPNVHFVVAGSGDLAAELSRAMTEMPVSVLGWRSDVETLLAASDVLALTSDNEGTPLSVIQAGMAGVPSVSTRVGGLASVIQDGSTGVLVDPEPHAVAKGICSILEQPAVQIAMGDESRRHMAAKFGLPAMIENHAKLYRELMRP